MGRHSTEITADEVAGIAAQAPDALHYADELTEIIGERGYVWEPIGDAADGGVIANVNDSDGQYLYTLTVSRTPGY